LLCVALLDELHSGLECDVLWCDVPNNPNLQTENSRQCN